MGRVVDMVESSASISTRAEERLLSELAWRATQHRTNAQACSTTPLRGEDFALLTYMAELYDQVHADTAAWVRSRQQEAESAPEPNPVAEAADKAVIAKVRECETRARVSATEVYPHIPGAQVMTERCRLEERRYRQLVEAAPRIFAECDRRDGLAGNAAADKEEGR